ncbi:MAG TPA: class I SAM-dependent RNA methyltransferase [Nitrospirae bacterium]|nr:ribosomal RNA large subunit methyltransferase L [bacterium BMS3Abin10]GBE39300.1 ribosomal RNA large subunit methyltransferase L [bacterium BMS3Bbin08]HDH50102.1 class I SAM-dependent RNA methyltransferase [Nitrospirota bacterium]HDK17543.1 class I SAM-dependent RNA methyltransferase [Nitrospirota bacterium]HDK81920.1 class I SAM-dependent RNA methyltransferase [Nitrospirota bacterium]
MSYNKIRVTCAKGITPFLKEELILLGFPIISETVAGIETEGTMDDTLRLNLLLRTGHRVLFLLRKFRAENADDLYQKGSNIAWEEYIAGNGYFSVSSSVDNPTIKTPLFANLKLKDAIVDRIRKKSGQRPDSGPEKDRAVLNLYWKNTDCSIYLDTSGEPLSKRNYRKIPMNAPMQETLAAAVIQATAWNGSGHFINPMCGSGTLAIEAALLGLNRASGILRNNFGFMHLKGFNGSLWKDLRAQAKKETKKSLDCRIIATDISEDAVEAARNNAATAGVEHLIEFDVCDYPDTSIPDGSGIVILNPGYGEREGKSKELESVYKGIGDFFKQKCKGYTGYIFTGNLDLAKKVGLKAKKRVPFFNGPIDCRLLEYELYEGSKKNKQKGL